jgi:hypothetical protein
MSFVESIIVPRLLLKYVDAWVDFGADQPPRVSPTDSLTDRPVLHPDWINLRNRLRLRGCAVADNLHVAVTHVVTSQNRLTELMV